MRRFYCREPISGSPLVLTGAEAHHMLHVDRIRPGQDVALFDGTGGEYRARLTDAAKDAAHLEVIEHVPGNRVPKAEVILMSAVPKGPRSDVLVQMACELGVTTLLPIISSRSVVRPGANKLEHWQRIVISACKQCGRNLLMTVETPVKLSEALEHPVPGALKLLLSTTEKTCTIPEVLREGPTDKVCLLVGPEGDFTDAEVSQAVESGFRPVSLGPVALRTETAGICASALVLAGLG